MYHFRFVLIFIAIFNFACNNKEEIKPLPFLTGDNIGLNLKYVLLNPPQSIDFTYYENDTIIDDTLSLDLNQDKLPEFKFVIEQKFFGVHFYNYDRCPPSQSIKIIVSSDIQLQLFNPELINNMNYNIVKTAQTGDTIDMERKWASRNTYFLTSFFGNSSNYPRIECPYLSFLYKNDQLGWLKFNMVMTFYNIEMTRFYIDEYCIKN